MKAMMLRSPAGLDQLVLEDRAGPAAPGSGEVRVALHGSSLNFHDLGVGHGHMPTGDRRTQLADGAGIIQAVGKGVTEFQPDDMVVSCFFPGWRAARRRWATFTEHPATAWTALRASML